MLFLLFLTFVFSPWQTEWVNTPPPGGTGRTRWDRWYLGEAGRVSLCRNTGKTFSSRGVLSLSWKRKRLSSFDLSGYILVQSLFVNS